MGRLQAALLAAGVLLSSAVAEDDLDARFERLQAWVQEGIDAANLGPSSPAPLADTVKLAMGRFGRSLFSKRNFAVNDTIFLMPLSHVIFHRDFSPGLESLSSHQQTMVYIARQRLLGNESKWKPYLDMCPESFDLPKYWDSSLMQEHMKGSHFPEFVDVMFTSMKHEWNTAWEQTGGKLGGIRWEDYAWGHEVHHTRSIFWHSNKWFIKGQHMPGRSSALMPFFDLLMHSYPNNAEYTFDFDLQAIKVFAVAPIEAGDELTITYFEPDQRSNMEILNKWGFCVEEGRKMGEVKLPPGRVGLDGKSLDVAEQGLPTNVPISDEDDVVYALERTGTDGAANALLAHLRARATQDAMYLPELPEGWWGVPDPKTGWLYFWHDATGETVWEKPGDPEGAKRPTLTPATTWMLEFKVLERAKEIIKAALAEYPTTLQQDLDLLEGNSITDHRVRFLTVVRKDEKQVFHWWLNLIASILNSNVDPEDKVELGYYMFPDKDWHRPHSEL